MADVNGSPANKNYWPFRRRTLGRRAKSAFPSHFDRWRRSLPSYLSFYILVALLAYAAWYGFHPATVIAPFHIPPEDKDHPLPFSGEAAADALQAAITSIQREAGGVTPPPPCDFPTDHEKEYGGLRAQASTAFQIRGPVTVEVKGFSPEALKSAAREVLGNERFISGDIILDAPGSGAFRLMAQANDHGPWMTKPQAMKLAGLKLATCELAERILGATDKNVLAAAWIRRGKYEDAIQLYRDLPAEGGDADALNNLGVAVRMKCSPQESEETSRPTPECMQGAVTRFHQALAVRWTFPEAHYNLANALYVEKNYDEAIAEYREAIKLRPGFTVAYYNLGNALYDQKAYAGAIAEYREAIKLQPDFAMAYYNLGLALSNNQDYTAAKAAYQEAIDLGSDPQASAWAYNNLGYALYGKKDYAAAVADYREAIKLKPDCADAYYNLGSALFDEKDYAQAIAAYSEVIKLKPDVADAYYSLGTAYYNNKKYRDAIAAYRAAIRLKPDYAMAHNGLKLALQQEAGRRYR